jgi:hypothetical protein
MGVTLEHAWAERWKFNEYYKTLSLKEQVNFYGGSPSSITQYLMCHACGAFCTNMREYQEGDCPDGVTLSPIVAHSQLVFDRAEQDDLRVGNHLLARAAELIRRIHDLQGLSQAELQQWLQDYARLD